MSEIKSYYLMPWGTFNSVNYSSVVGSLDAYTTGVGVFSRDGNYASLYTSPSELYPFISRGNSITYRNSYRKQSPVSIGTATEYRQLPNSCEVSIDDKVFAEQRLNAYALGKNVSKIPYSNYIQDILSRYGSISELLKLVGEYYSLKDFNNTEIFVTDKGSALASSWGTNYTVLGSEPVAYNYARPALLFDTREIQLADSIVSARICLTLDTTKPILNEDGINLYIKLLVNNGTDLNFDPISSEVLIIPIGSPELLSGQEVSIPIGASYIQKKNYTKFAIISNLEKTNTLPTGFNQITFKDVRLQIELNKANATVPGPVSIFNGTRSGTSVMLSWSPPLDNGGYPISAYYIKCLTTGQEYWTDALTQLIALQGLQAGVDYSYSIQAQNNVGISATPVLINFPASGTSLIPGAPSGLTATGADGSVTIRWNEPLFYAGQTPEAVSGGVAGGTGKITVSGYLASSNSTNQTVTTDANTREATFTGLQNGVDYVFSVQAFNSSGYSQPIFIYGRPTPIGQDQPEVPIITLVGIKVNGVAFSWKIPKDLSGLRIPNTELYYIKLTNLDKAGTDPLDPGEHMYFQALETGQWGGNLVIPNLVPSTRYRLCVKSVNGVGESPWVCSNIFYVAPPPPPPGGGGGGPPPIDPGGKVLVPINYNYQNFYTAPVNLDRASENYGDFIYPETVTEDFSAYINGEEVQFPLEFTALKKKLYLNVSGTSYTIQFTDGLVLDHSNTEVTLNTLAASVSLPARFIVIGNRIVLETIEKGANVFVNFDVNLQKDLDCSSIIFGENPTILPGDVVYLVTNHVPVTDYDRSNKKSLIESKNLMNIYNRDISKATLWSVSQTGLAIDLDVHSIQPNSVSLSYFDESNKQIFLRDYFGDGNLYNRTKTFENVGDPITWSYTTDITTSSDILGLFDYKTGTITNLVLFTTEGYNSFRKAKIKSNVGWPVKVLNDSFLYLDVNGNKKTIAIPKNTVGYSPSTLVTLLNATSSFVDAGLVASVENSQLVVTNSLAGPTRTLELDNVQTLNNANRGLFGLKPYVTKPSKIYISYSYAIEDQDKFHHIWYQTPHFVIKAKGVAGTFLTSAHLSYILDKVNLIKPATTVLDRVGFGLDIGEAITCAESLNILIQTPPPDPGTCTITLGSLTASVGGEGISGASFDVIASGATCVWTATSNDNWITIISAASNTGSGKVFFDVASNPGVDRSGTITVANNTFTVFQTAVGGCVIILNPSSIYIQNGGVDTKVTISVATGVSCPWSASTTDSWIRVPASASGTGNGSFAIGVLANPGAPRTGTVLVGDQLFQVIQEGSNQLITPPYIRISSMVPDPYGGVIIPPIVIPPKVLGAPIEPPIVIDHTYDVKVVNPDLQYDLKPRYYTYQ